VRRILSVCLAGLAVWVGVRAGRSWSVVAPFRNPVAFTVVGDTLYVLEKQDNTVLVLDCSSPERSLPLRGRFRIEQDDPEHYYMVRHLYPSPGGVMAQSFIYEKKAKALVGYRFREYASFQARPRDVFTIYLKEPKDYPEVSYTFAADGTHYFLNNCAGQKNIWRLARGACATMSKGVAPAELKEMGDRNEALTSWGEITLGPDGRMYVSSNDSGRIVEYAADGQRRRTIGEVGFQEGQLLAPWEVGFAPAGAGGAPCLTVASGGNRTWVQFGPDGAPLRTIAPRKLGYRFPDILVGNIYVHAASGRLCSFDLVNRSFVLLGEKCEAVTTFRTVRIGTSCLLCGAALLLLATACLCWRGCALWERLRFPFFLKLLLLFVPLLVVSGLIVGDWVKDIMKEDLDAEYVRRSANLAHAIRNSIPLSDLEAIQAPEDRGGEVYERIHKTVTSIVDVKSVDFTPKWIIHKIRDGKYYFGINIWRGPIYEPFIIPIDRQMFFDVLVEKTPQYGRFCDDQGEWFSYLCPILNAGDEVVYVVELYRPSEAMDRTDRKVSHRVSRTVGTTVLAAILLVLVFSYLFTRPLRELTRATEVVSTGNFDHKIVVRSRDELSNLATAFNDMVVDLRKYTEDLARTTAENERIQSELRLAHDMQQSVLPKLFPPFAQAESIEIFARMEPARDVGGDYYDFFLVDDAHMGALVADVSGKGVAAGLFMMVVRTLLRSHAMGNLSAADAVSKVNAMIAPDNPSCMFVTLFYFVCDVETGKVTFCNAGHNPPLRLSGDRVEILTTERGSGQGVAVGILDDAEYSDAELVLAPGESLVLYTDGVTEPVDRNNKMYGEERMLQCIERHASSPNERICTEVYEEVIRHQEGLEQFDDITILFFKFLDRAE